MTQFPAALACGPIIEVFSDVFLVSGAMETELMDLPWQFSRNMIVVRSGSELTLFNTLRLEGEQLRALETLGTIANVVRLGALHGRDDAFYVEGYGAALWSIPGVEHASSLVPDHVLEDGTVSPLPHSEVFCFRTTAIPEAIVRLDRHDGVLIACDALQNWIAPDKFFDESSIERMQSMGFFERANFGPVWMQAANPDPADFRRLLDFDFAHVLAGHGEPLLNDAKSAFEDRFRKTFSDA